MTIKLGKPGDLLPRCEPTEYCPRASLASARHAMAIYDHPARYDQYCVGAGFDGANVLTSGGAQVGVAYSPEVIAVTPRGTSQLLDVLADLGSVIRVQCDNAPKGARIGFGFRVQARKITPSLLDYLLHLGARYPDAKMALQGHSLGAALCPPLAATLSQYFKAPLVIYAHCSPRVGNRAFAEWFNAAYPQTFATVNVWRGEVDPITRVPLLAWGWGETGQRAFFCDGKRYSDRDWQEYRRKHPVTTLQGIRIITRILRGRTAHSSRTLLKALELDAEKSQ